MGDKDRNQGERDLIRGRATDEDAEGHGYKWKGDSPGTDQPPSDESDTEGQGYKIRGADDDAPTDDTEGHF